MTNNLLLLLLIPLASKFIVSLVENMKVWGYYLVYTKKTPYKEFRLKPLDCPSCLSFHLMWIFLLTSGLSIPLILLHSFAAATLGYLISKL